MLDKKDIIYYNVDCTIFNVLDGDGMNRKTCVPLNKQNGLMDPGVVIKPWWATCLISFDEKRR